MPWSSVERFTDPVACQLSIQCVTDYKILPTTRGNFDTKITKVRFDRLWMQRINSSLPQITVLERPSDRLAITFITEPTSPNVFCRGREVLPGDVVINRTELEHKRVDADVRIGAMSLPKDELGSAFEGVMGYGKHDLRIVRPDPALMSRLLKLHKAVGRLARHAPDILEADEVGRALEQQLIPLMMRCVAERDTSKPSAANGRHDQIMMRFEEFLEANPDRPIYLTEICAALAISERTLRSFCRERLGMGPIRYLTLRRMHLVRRALQRSDPAEATVTKIVTDHGFWELGRFSVAYRALFGEIPSATLRSPSELTAINLNRPSSLAVGAIN